MLSSVLVLVPFILGINAANDWNVPCTTGQCEYDLPTATNASASGTVKIWGSTDAISDITTAAGWQILGCNSSALSQDLRLVCMNDPSDASSQCAHLYQGAGAVNKIVRLPENCGASAFARISNAWVPSDQSIPASVKARVVRRSGTPPVVKALSIDTNFDAVDYSKTGPVNIAIQGANVPGAPNTIQIPGSRRLKNVATKAATDVKNVATKAGSDVKAAATAVAGDATAAASKVKGAAESAATATNNKVDLNHAFTLPPITFDKSANLINQAVQCGPVSASLNVDVDANANAQVTVTVAATGTLVPPKFTSFGVVAGMTATAAGTMTMTADVTGQVDSGSIQLVNIGIPGFDLPGLLTLGPSFQVNAQLTGDVDVTMDMTLGVNLNLNNAQLSFPPDASNAPDSNAFSLGDTPITLNAAPDVTATGTITAHLIPSLNLGVSALGGKAQATVFLALDTNAAVQLSLDGSASATKVIDPNAGAAGNGTVIDDGSAGNSTSTDDGSDTAATVTDSLGGCVNVNGGINVNAGVDGDFFDLFDKTASVSLFSKDFQIFQKCFGDQAAGATAATTTRRSTPRLTRLTRFRRLALSCPAAGAAEPVTAIPKQTVKSAECVIFVFN
ncbi:hypothetical protein B0H11DRAFT_1753194 [Mycena galericulata]|nr:hypothetical protein B0H11DRAFT_1753194 [Mycena galericulata]